MHYANAREKKSVRNNYAPKDNFLLTDDGHKCQCQPVVSSHQLRLVSSCLVYKKKPSALGINA